jgi:predicted nucleotidyltransferase
MSAASLHLLGFGGAPDRSSAILAALRAEEEARGIRILYAAESGSRAWGFASPDSDWDVRALYVHPRDWYLRIEDKPRDTFESMHPGDIDLSAWELRKALRLFAKSNLPLFEWLGSPLVYLDRGGFGDRLRALVPNFFDPRGAAWHHLSMQRSALEDLAPDGTIRIKKLCYALRSALSVHWIAARTSMPPVPFPELFAASHLDSVAREAIDAVLTAKRDASERDRITLSPILAMFFEKNEHLVPIARFPARGQADVDELDEFFRIVLTDNRYDVMAFHHDR